MRSVPEALEEDDLFTCLVDGWGVEARSAHYLPVGGGSYHWDIVDGAGRRHFVTVDDLDRKAWLGADRDTTFAGLRAAFDTALALHGGAGLAFVIAPIPAADGTTVRRIDARYVAALFPFVDATAGTFGEAGPPRERAEVIGLLAELHRATPVARPIATPHDLDLPLRGRLEAALRELDRPWTGGPLSEPARELLADRAAELRRRLEAFDRLADEVMASPAELVVTHGEPHAGNVLRTPGRDLLLVDWDTVGLAPPERDLWHVCRDAGDLALYAEATGHRVDPRAIDLYRLRWQLDDVAIFTSDLRSPHVRSGDTERALEGLNVYLRTDGGGS